MKIFRRARLSARTMDERLLAPGPGYRLLEVHTLVALVIGLGLATRDWTLIAGRPPVLTTNLTVMSWLPGPVPAPLLVALQVAGLIGVTLVVARRHQRLGFITAWSTYLALTALWGSSGKVMHNDVLTVLVGAVLVFAVLPAPGQQEAMNSRWGWPPRAALAVIGVVYLLTGVQKLRESGLPWVFSDNMQWILRQGVSPLGEGFTDTVSQQLWLTQVLSGGALLLEITAPIWLMLRMTRIPFAASVALMHLSIWACLGLDYSAWILTVIAVAAPMGLPIAVRLAGERSDQTRPTRADRASVAKTTVRP